MTASKLVLSAASGVGGAGLDVDEVFNTFLYEGTGSSRSITNGIDLSGEGGLVWIKNRNNTGYHHLFDTARGTLKALYSNDGSAEATWSNSLTSFNSDGFSLGNSAQTNQNQQPIVSWTFRKAPNFFDVVTYTGNATARTISHNLDSVPGMIIVKRVDSNDDWWVYHRGNTNAPETDYLRLNEDNGTSDSANVWNDTAPTATEFSIKNNSLNNANGGQFIAYLFAHNNNDGDFGPNQDQDIIKCGDFTTDGSENATVTLGFEPQWVLWKPTATVSNWHMFDAMRGMPFGRADALLEPDGTGAETQGVAYISPTATGFNVTNMGANKHSIFIAIRRGPLAAPTSSSQVFEVDNAGSTGDGVDPKFRSGFPVDFALRKDVGNSSNNWEVLTRLLQGTSLRLNDTNAEDSGSGGDQFDYMNGYNTGTNTDSDLYSWMWKRAPKYFDVVTYTGASGAQTITHNLGVVPEMIWLKKRSEVSATNGGWVVYHGTTSNLILNENFSSGFAVNNSVNHSTISATTFEVANGNTDVNDVGEDHVAYLFASVAGVSKIGSVTHSGSTDVDCGFSNGSKFVLLKQTDAADSWRLFDSDRGIVSGNDPFIFPNAKSAQTTSQDRIDPLSSGFQITSGFTNGTYLFYAIAA